VKRTTKSSLLIVAALLAATAGAFAGSGGSAYSIVGIGDIRLAAGGRSAGMGDAGVGLASPYSINFLSPASWSRINQTRFEGGALYEGFNSTDGSRSRYLARMDFNGALLAIPVSTGDGITAVVGFVPYTNVNYNTFTHGSKVTPVDTLSYTLNEIGTGGITKGMIGVSWSPHRSVSVGLAANYLFGTYSTKTIQTVTGAYGGIIVNERSASGVNFTAGVLVADLGAPESELRKLSFGAVVTTRATLNSTLRTNYEYTSEYDTSSESNGRAGIPVSATLGIGYRFSERWVAAADFGFQPWSTADLSFIAPGAVVRNASRTSVGVERSASRNYQAAWLDRIAYRFGASYAQTYVTAQNQAINELAVTAGLTFPVSGDSRLHVAATYGTRGTTSAGLISEKIFRIAVSLSVADLWYVHLGEE
jgi:hypothetical protein